MKLKTKAQKEARRRYRKRYREANKNVIRQLDKYVMIDGNYTHYPVAYCRYRRGYVTEALKQVHNCDECKFLIKLLGVYKNV